MKDIKRGIMPRFMNLSVMSRLISYADLLIRLAAF